MKFNKYAANLLIIAGLITVSCSKLPITIPDHVNDPGTLAGTWKWVTTDGGIAYNIHDTPTSTGKNIDLFLTPDNKYSFVTNGVVTSEGTFILKAQKCIHDNTDKNVIDFSSPADMSMMIESMGNNTLRLSDDCSDGIESRYTRK